MKARALITHDDRTFTLDDVMVPDVRPDEIGIRVQYSGVSIGTELALIRKKITWQDFPLCTGYMASGIVDRVGGDVAGFGVGDKVFVRGNREVTMDGGTKVGCTEGAHSSYIVRDPAGPEGCGIIPEGTDMGAGAMFVMPAVALNGLSQAQPEAPQTVLVYGVGLIGIGSVALGALRGCEVIAVDINDTALSLAASMGAEHLINASAPDWRDQVRAIVPDGADCVVEPTGIPECVDTAIALCRRFGSFIWQGNYGAAPITYQFLPAHGRQIRAFYPCHDGQMPYRQRVIRLMATGASGFIGSALARSMAAKHEVICMSRRGAEIPGTIPVRGVLNEAVILSGDRLFVDMYDARERASRVLGLTYNLAGKQIATNGSGCMLANCTVPMVGPRAYEEWLLPLEVQIATMCHSLGGVFSMHHCGNLDEYALLYRRLCPMNTHLDIGHESTIQLALDVFPEARISQIVDSHLMNSGSPDEVATKIQELLSATKGHHDRFILNVCDVDYGAPDGNIFAVCDALLGSAPSTRRVEKE